MNEMWDGAVKTKDPIEKLVATANTEVQRIIDKYKS